MKAARAILAVLWLILALSATVHAMPATACPMADMPSHSTARVHPGAMPCCNQPAVVEAPAAEILPLRRLEPLQLFPAPSPVLAGRAVVAEPHPPKSFLNA